MSPWPREVGHDGALAHSYGEISPIKETLMQAHTKKENKNIYSTVT